MTGFFLPMNKIGLSILNNFFELTMVDPSWTSEYIGYTIRKFKNYVKCLLKIKMKILKSKKK